MDVNKKHVEQAILKAKQAFDEWNEFRYKQMLTMISHGNKLTTAEKHDVWSYLTRSK